MSMKKKKAAPVASHRTGAKVSAPTPPTEEQKAKAKKFRANTTLAFVISLLAMFAIFGGRWVWAIMEEYYGAFVQRYSASVDDAVSNMEGLILSEEEENAVLSLRQEWDLFTSSRLRDEVTVTGKDGVELHGYLYNEGSDITVVVLPRFNQDGTDDFLPGTWLNETTGCNLLMPDPRLHGESGGEKFGYGYYEQYDLAAWLAWCDEALGEQTYILWGEGVGANTILFAERNGLLPDNVAFVVAESSIASIHEMASTQIFEWYTVPAFPFLAAIEFKVNRNAGYRMDDIELADALTGADCATPVLFLESATDQYIYPEWSMQVYNAYSGAKHRISGGLNHGTVYTYRQDEIHTTLESWLAEYVH